PGSVAAAHAAAPGQAPSGGGGLNAQDPDPTGERPSTFQGWQRGACILGVVLLAIFALLLVLGVVLGVLGIH
ncbi:MAG: hypothetical protein ACYCYK_07950, partial [Candidatus Dormibacteria bacterium]